MLISILLVAASLLVVGTVLGLISMGLSKSTTGFLNAAESAAITGNSGIQANPAISAAVTGTLTTRTNGTSGVITMTAGGHGIVTGQRVDLYWAAGRCYGAVVGTVSGTSVPIASVSGGDVLPSTSTAMMVGKITTVPFNVIGNNMQALGAAGSQSGYFVWADGSSDLFAAYVPGSTVYQWYTGSGITNPLASQTSTKVYMSTSYTTADVTDMKAATVVN